MQLAEKYSPDGRNSDTGLRVSDSYTELVHVTHSLVHWPHTLNMLYYTRAQCNTI